MNYEHKSFSIMPGTSDAYRENFDRIFKPSIIVPPSVDSSEHPRSPGAEEDERDDAADAKPAPVGVGEHNGVHG